MGKLKSFSINLDSVQPVYYPYQVVSGSVVLELKEPMEVRSVMIKLKGESCCEWTNKELCKRNNDCYWETVIHSGEETIIKYELMLSGKTPSSDQRSFHAAGRHVYAFSFPLPGHLPSTFEGEFGCVRYVLKANIDRPWKLSVKAKLPIIINDIIDPNLTKYNAHLITGEKHETINCICNTAGSLSFMVDIDRNCACPGEALFINANVQNHSKKDMNSIYAKLIQTVKYNATSLSKTQTKVVADLKGPKICRFEEESWINQPFRIPALPPTIKNSSIINISYILLIGVSIPKRTDAIIEFDVTVGTVPFKKIYGKKIEYDSKQASNDKINALTTFHSPLPECFGDDFDSSLPSYAAPVDQAESHIGNNRDEYTHGKLHYMPLYTYAQPYETLKKK